MEALLSVHMSSRREAKIMERAISVDSSPGSKSSREINSSGSVVQIKITATDLGALRASLNSTLRGVMIVGEVL